MYSIYKISNCKNGKIYIGYTGQEPHWYIKEHFANARNGVAKLLYSAIRKHGEVNFSYELLYQTPYKDHATDMERYFISEYNSHCKTGHGYNVTFGGDGGDTSYSPIYQAGMKRRAEVWATHPPEHIKPGWKHTQTTKDKMSVVRVGKPPGNYDDFIMFAKNKSYMHKLDDAKEIRVKPEDIQQYERQGFIRGRLRIPCEHCGMLSDKGNMARHLRTTCTILKQQNE